ncbi:MAG: 4a-hydroxytetrahydrobiopterin dehydratase [Candidatus Omnitrophica bacterium]|nr:4a-hydroxytetrahydrobiopterin dehydratase [Candidatus Omnitrophota bacterium]
MERKKIAPSIMRSRCLPCEGQVRPITLQEARQFTRKFTEWRVNPREKLIYARYRMRNFQTAIEFILAIARLAESEGHHPDIHLTHYRQVCICLKTHAVNGLSLNDLMLAMRISKLPKKLQVAL